jgi:uncharacterized protein (TIGR03067 family)
MAVSAVLVGLAGAAAGDGAGDKERLQGEWAALSIKFGDTTLPDKAVMKSNLVIKGDVYVGTINQLDMGRHRIALDESKDPKQIDLTPIWEGGGGTVKGIYKLDGDTLTVCRPITAAGARPKEFKAGEGVGVGVYKRAAKK